MTEPVPAERASRQAGDRVARNALVRAAGDILGKLASLALFAVLARSAGEAGLGVYVFAFAWVEIATTPTGIGVDRYFLRRVAADRSRRDELVNVVALKLSLAVPIVLISFAAASILGYDDQTRAVIYVLTPGLLMDSLARSFFSVFTAHERGELLAATIVVQRFAAAGLGLVAVGLGLGLVTVATAYSAGAGLGLLLAVWLLRRHLGRISLRVAPRIWRQLLVRSLPFGAQDVFGVLLARVDAVILSLMATQAAVGRYGAAYRLLEATFFLTTAIAGAFAAMFTYLGHDTAPRLRDAFQRSIKLSLAVTVPLAVGLSILAEPVLTLIFGADFAAAAPALRLLAPAVVLISLVFLCSSLIVSRGSPTSMAVVVAVMATVNIALNLLLVPAYGERGAAGAMSLTEVIAVPVVLAIAARRAGGLDWAATLAGPLLAGGAMTGPMLLLAGEPLLAALAGGVVYFSVLLAVERLLAPADLAFIADMVRRRLPSSSHA